LEEQQRWLHSRQGYPKKKVQKNKLKLHTKTEI